LENIIVQKDFWLVNVEGYFTLKYGNMICPYKSLQTVQIVTSNSRCIFIFRINFVHFYSCRGICMRIELFSLCAVVFAKTYVTFLPSRASNRQIHSEYFFFPPWIRPWLWTIPFSSNSGSISICYVRQWLKYSEWIWRFEARFRKNTEGTKVKSHGFWLVNSRCIFRVFSWFISFIFTAAEVFAWGFNFFSLCAVVFAKTYFTFLPSRASNLQIYLEYP
jgi:hypothetical protein